MEFNSDLSDFEEDDHREQFSVIGHAFELEFTEEQLAKFDNV
jgi:hypothetical protein